jgi:hypothetical protein
MRVERGSYEEVTRVVMWWLWMSEVMKVQGASICQIGEVDQDRKSYGKHILILSYFRSNERNVYTAIMIA